MLDINAIVQEQLQQMAESKIIEKTIQETFNNTIIKVVKEQFSDYELRRKIEQKLGVHVNDAISQLDFTGYNHFILDTFKSMIDGQVKQEVIQNTEKAVKELLFVKRETINFSELIEKYRTHLNESYQDYNKFKIELKDENFSFRKDGDLYQELKIFAISNDYYEDKEELIAVRICRYSWDKMPENTYRIQSIHFNNQDMEKLSWGKKSDLELLLINIAVNDTRLVMDVDIDDIDAELCNDDD